MKTALGIGIVIILLLLVMLITTVVVRTSMTDAKEVQGLTDAQRREGLLMPEPDSEAHKEWVAKYGDNADSWELFTLTFHTKYLASVDKRLIAIEKKLADPNSEPGTAIKEN